MNLPKARTTDLLEQEADNELLIYDLRIDKAYNLNETLKNIFARCDGKTSFDDLKRKHNYTDDLIYLALQELNQNDLLEDYQSNHFAGLSRREVIRKVGLATMFALPVISSLIAPKSIQAASGATLAAGSVCTASSQCQNNNCCAVNGNSTCTARRFFPSPCVSDCECTQGRCLTNECL